MKVVIIILGVIFLSSCDNSDNWQCVTQGDAMFSQSSSGELAGAGKACSCQQIRSFEMDRFGEVDEVALKADFGC